MSGLSIVQTCTDGALDYLPFFFILHKDSDLSLDYGQQNTSVVECKLSVALASKCWSWRAVSRRDDKLCRFLFLWLVTMVTEIIKDKLDADKDKKQENETIRKDF